MHAEFRRHLGFIFHEKTFLDPFYAFLGINVQFVDLFLLDNGYHSLYLFD